MDGNTSSSLILLTYKNKALLMYKQKNSLDDGRDAWSFIGSAKNANEPDETALKRNVEQEMGIKVGNVEYVSESCYHASLTDDNVNQINRAEGHLLSFFTLKEIEKLLLSSTTRDFVSKHSSLIQDYSQ